MSTRPATYPHLRSGGPAAPADLVEPRAEPEPVHPGEERRPAAAKHTLRRRCRRRRALHRRRRAAAAKRVPSPLCLAIPAAVAEGSHLVRLLSQQPARALAKNWVGFERNHPKGPRRAEQMGARVGSVGGGAFS